MRVGMFRQLIAAGALVCGVGLWDAAPASAGNGGVTYAVACSEGDGLIDITLYNLGAEGDVSFSLTNPIDGAAESVVVAPGRARAVTYAGFPDGPASVRIVSDGDDLSVSADVRCDPPTCPAGAAPIVSEINGVPTAQCVAQAPPAPADGKPSSGALSGAGGSPSGKPAGKPSSVRSASQAAPPAQLPATGGTALGLWLGAAMVGCGAVASLVSRRRH
jgi:hypothetical protein